MGNRPIFNIFPIRSVETHNLEWEQKDNYVGLQQVRGLNGQPGRVKMIGGKRFIMSPGVYGEYIPIDEKVLTERRQWGNPLAPIDIIDLVREAQDQLLGRRLDRIEQIGWTLLSTGTFSVAQNNVVMHTDAYTPQTYGAGVVWATIATSTPLADFRAVQLKGRGISVNFGAQATAYMNRTTLNQMLSNTNAVDLAGRRVAGLASVEGLDDLNKLMAKDDLPNIQIYDEGYLNDAGTFQLFVPNNKVIVVGQRRDGDPLGEYRMTRNANNPQMESGPYMLVVDNQGREVPRQIQVHDGHNGGPVMFHPGAVVIMTV
jgi:hypothetical protein